MVQVMAENDGIWRFNVLIWLIWECKARWHTCTPQYTGEIDLTEVLAQFNDRYKRVTRLCVSIYNGWSLLHLLWKQVLLGKDIWCMVYYWFCTRGLYIPARERKCSIVLEKYLVEFRKLIYLNKRLWQCSVSWMWVPTWYRYPHLVIDAAGQYRYHPGSGISTVISIIALAGFS